LPALNHQPDGLEFLFLLSLFLPRAEFDLGGIQQLLDVGVRASVINVSFASLIASLNFSD